MSSAHAERKPLGVRVTSEQHQLLRQAAEREHRSVSGFVLQAALKAATAPPATQTQSPEEVRAAIRRIQEDFKRANVDGSDPLAELFSQRRAEAAREEEETREFDRS